jgi:hypothetical protein
MSATVKPFRVSLVEPVAYLKSELRNAGVFVPLWHRACFDPLRQGKNRRKHAKDNRVLYSTTFSQSLKVVTKSDWLLRRI